MRSTIAISILGKTSKNMKISICRGLVGSLLRANQHMECSFSHSDIFNKADTWTDGQNKNDQEIIRKCDSYFST